MNNMVEFRPEWVSAPGDTIADILKERVLSDIDFASLIGQSPAVVNDLLQGRATITISIARQLERVLGASVEFWMSRDYQFRQDVSRLHETDVGWLRELPIADMIRFGWLQPVPHPSEELSACLRFFNLPSVTKWREEYASLHQIAAFRTSPSFDSQPGSVATWLRQGAIEAETIDCGDWDHYRFHEALASVRSLTRIKNPKQFIPELQKRCAENGVAVVIVRTPSGCRASGAVRFLSRNKAVMQLSFRYLTDDHFWFSFFHEAGHLLLHGERYFFSETLEEDPGWMLEDVDAFSASEEQEANDFAANTLIPPEIQTQLPDLRSDWRTAVRFAMRVGVSPGIIVGQMQHLGIIGHNQFNRLKRRYRWDN